MQQPCACSARCLNLQLCLRVVCVTLKPTQQAGAVCYKIQEGGGRGDWGVRGDGGVGRVIGEGDWGGGWLAGEQVQWGEGVQVSRRAC